VRHRERAAHAGFDLRERHELGRARHVRPRALQPFADPERQQRMPRRMELDAVVPVQDRRVLIRKPPPLERLAPELRPEREQFLLGPRRSLSAQRLEQGRVCRDDVVVTERWRLIR
jgi:hypothetical protein